MKLELKFRVRVKVRRRGEITYAQLGVHNDLLDSEVHSALLAPVRSAPALRARGAALMARCWPLGGV